MADNTMKTPTIFGREPAAVVGTLQAVLVLVALLAGLDTVQVGATAVVLVVLGDLYVAYKTRATMLGLVIGLLKAGVAVFAAWGIDASPELVTGLVGFVTAVAGLFQRTQTSPVSQGSFDLAA